MKKLLSLFGFILFFHTLIAQSQIENLVQKGIELHDIGQYDKAVELYKQALGLEPNSALVHYEISLSYMYLKDYQNSLKHSNKVIKLNDKYLLEAYITKGSCLDYLGKTKESIKLFEKGIKKFGDNHLLYYNLGYNYFHLKNYAKAEEALVNAINTNPGHASSHLLLSYVMADTNKKSQSLLSLNYFLFLEPGSERAKTAFGLLQKQFSDNVERNNDNPKEISITINSDQVESEFGAADLSISMFSVSYLVDEEKNDHKSEEEAFIKKTISFFKILAELKSDSKKSLWWEFYVPFFYKISESEHIATYCYYISQSSNNNAQEWLNNNSEKLEKFDQWLNSL